MKITKDPKYFELFPRKSSWVNTQVILKVKFKQKQFSKESQSTSDPHTSQRKPIKTA